MSTESEFDRFFREHYRAVHGFVRRAFPGIDADDIASVAFTIAWRRFDEVPGHSRRAWLFAVVRNTVNNERRSGRRAALVLERAIAERPRTVSTQDDLTVSPEAVAELVDGFNRLRRDDREILVYAAWGGLDPAELAVVLGTTTNAACVRLHRARTRLRAATAIGNVEVGGSVGRSAPTARVGTLAGLAAG